MTALLSRDLLCTSLRQLMCQLLTKQPFLYHLERNGTSPLWYQLYTFLRQLMCQLLTKQTLFSSSWNVTALIPKVIRSVRLSKATYVLFIDGTHSFLFQLERDGPTSLSYLLCTSIRQLMCQSLTNQSFLCCNGTWQHWGGNRLHFTMHQNCTFYVDILYST